MEPSAPAASAWDRLQGETSRAFAAFEVYRELGPTRSMSAAVAAYRAKYGKAPKGREKSRRREQGGNGGETGARKIPSHWEVWAAQYTWRDRAAKWDAAQVLEERRRAEDAHKAKVDAYLNRQQRLAAAATEATIGMLGMINRTLKQMTSREEMMLPAKQLPQFVRAAAAISETTTNAEAQAIGVEQLLRDLEGMR
ncbi:MAG TPA: hypothetical protein VFR37_05450 [Longimicrobium sp.]|nr:hypothetical protein [Longimicrobium sp.]